jgi:predicted nucleic acid-binding protein
VVKLYADEPGSDAIRALVQPVVSVLARVEVVAALWRKVRVGELDQGDGAILVTAFESDWYGEEPGTGRFAAVAVTGDVLGRAAGLLERHPLRAYDSLQLASAVEARRAGVVERFACFDRSLSAAARAEGFTLVPSA